MQYSIRIKNRIAIYTEYGYGVIDYLGQGMIVGVNSGYKVLLEYHVHAERSN